MEGDENLNNLQFEVHQALENIYTDSLHGDLLKDLLEENGILYEGCWEYCQIRNMLEVMKASTGLEGNVMTVDLDDLMAKKEFWAKRFDAFVGFNMTEMKKPEKDNVSKFTKEKKMQLKEKVRSNEILTRVYSGLMEE